MLDRMGLRPLRWCVTRKKQVIIGSELGAIPVPWDEIVETGLDYPMRNLYQVKHSHGLFILTGGDGTLEEAIASLADYRLPVAAVRGSGTAAAALEALLEIYPEWGHGLLFGSQVEDLVDPFLSLVRQSRSC